MEDNNSILCGDKVIVLIKGMFFSIFISLIMIFILSIILTFSNIKEGVIMPSVIFISSFSIFFGSFLVARRINENGIFYGSLVGMLYMLLLYCISSILSFNFSIDLNAIVMIMCGILGGALGGIFGVNLK